MKDKCLLTVFLVCLVCLSASCASEKTSEKAIDYNRQGLAAAKRGEYQEAIEMYSAAILLDPDYAEAYNNRGVAKKGSVDSSQQLLTMTLRYAWIPV